MPYTDMEEARRYFRERYRRNREAYLADGKRRYYANLEENRKVRREYYYKNREKILEKNKEYSKQYREQGQKKAANLYGNCCFFCGLVWDKERSNKSFFVFHEKSGSQHSQPTWKAVLENPEDFVLLCKRHHTGIHFCMEYLKMSWSEVVVKLRRH